MSSDKVVAPPVVDYSDPRIVLGQQKALKTLYLAGLREPGVYVCGASAEHEEITWHFAEQFQMMHAPHPLEPLRKSNGYLPLPPGPRIFHIVRWSRLDAWRHPFEIQLLVTISSPTQSPPATSNAAPSAG